MEIIKPSCELWVQDDPIAHVARCARICYASDKTTGNEAMYQRLIDSNHKSMLRHQSVYYIIPYKGWRLANLQRYEECPYLEFRYDSDYIYVSTNKQFVIEHNDFEESYHEFEVDGIEFGNTPIGFSLMRYTFKVVTQISTSRELNRVSPNNIAEQSTRYVNLSRKGGAICQPHWMTDETVEVFNTTSVLPDGFYSKNEKAVNYCWHCDKCFQVYNILINKGMLPEDARGVLPLDTATVCGYTYSISQWRDIIDLRYYGTTGKPHPNAKIIAGMIREKLIDAGHEFPKTKEEN
jgi:thymidylate synthase (FAD)